MSTVSTISTVSTVTTLVDLFDAASEQGRVQRDNLARGYTFLDGTKSVSLSFVDLRQRAEQTAGVLQQMGVGKGDTVLLIVPTSPDFAHIYWALQLCGAVPCVLPSPGSTGNDSQGVQRIQEVGKQMSARLLITTEQDAASWSTQAHAFRVVASSELLQLASDNEAAAWTPVSIAGDDVALIQATSGSTDAPKCVVLTHKNVLANLNQIGQRLGAHEGDVVCSWLPLFHDMGLVGCFLFVMRWQLHGVFMMPYRFLRRPVDWLRAISQYGATLSPAPNFAYALAAERVRDADLAGLDLSTWRSAMCGAEPIDVRVLQKFAQRFASCGFQETALSPCYGMAEAALAVTIHPPGQPMRVETIVRSQLVAEQPVTAYGGPDSCAEDTVSADDLLQVCACGPAMPGTEIQIRAADGSVLPAGHLGEIWIATPSLMRKYHGQAAITQAVLQHGWLNTGDVGYLRRGHLYVTGRSKELIIIRGHNYLPTDVEWAAAELTGITPGRVAAFGTYDATSGTDQLVVVCEQPRGFSGKMEELVTSIKSHVGKRTGLLPAHISIVPRNSIPHTTSGKLQRTLVKALYLDRWSQMHNDPGASSPQFV